MIQLNWSDEPGVWKNTAYRTVEGARASWDKLLADWIAKYGRPPMKATPNFREIPDEREPPRVVSPKLKGTCTNAVRNCSNSADFNSTL
jgi:hypothetical protein